MLRPALHLNGCWKKLWPEEFHDFRVCFATSRMT
jgi:hypothetical protein